jgi:hypothetical protein
VLVHRVVHRGREDERPAAGERGGGEQVVGRAGRELGQRVGAQRRDDEHVSGLDELQVRQRRVGGRRVAGEGAAQRVGLPLGDEHGRTGDSGERRGPDEPRRRLRLDHAHRMPGLGRQARELQRLVGRDPTGDAEQNAPHRRWISRGSGT